MALNLLCECVRLYEVINSILKKRVSSAETIPVPDYSLGPFLPQRFTEKVTKEKERAQSLSVAYHKIRQIKYTLARPMSAIVPTYLKGYI